MTGTRSPSLRSISTARRQPCEVLVSSSDSAPAARSDSRPLAPSSAAGPPCRIDSAAVTVTTRSVSISAGLTRRSTLPARPSATRSSASASWTRTFPLKRRRKSGGTRKPMSRGAVRRKRPPATRIVICETPSRVSSSATAAVAMCRGPLETEGIGSEGCSITIVAVPPRRTSFSSGSPASGNANASSTARPTSSSESRCRGGRSTRSSSPVSATTMRVSASSGMRVTRHGARSPRSRPAR